LTRRKALAYKGLPSDVCFHVIDTVPNLCRGLYPTDVFSVAREDGECRRGWKALALERARMYHALLTAAGPGDPLAEEKRMDCIVIASHQPARFGPFLHWLVRNMWCATPNGAVHVVR